MKENRAICPLLWMHLSANTDGSMRICCNTDNGGFVRNPSGEKIYLNEIGDLNDYVNNDFLKSLRRQMISGQRPEICRKCHAVEDEDGESLRQIYLKQHGDFLKKALEQTQTDGSIVPQILYLDFSLSNQCNLKCRMCDPVSSHLLKSEWQALEIDFDHQAEDKASKNWNYDSSFERLLDEVLHTCQEILITGGEPLINRMHLRMLHRAVENQCSESIVLRYHSNLMVLPDQVINLWRHFKRIEMHVSIEALGAYNDYVRYGSRWSTIMKNLDKYIELRKFNPDQFDVEVHTTFQALTVLRLPQLFDFLADFHYDFAFMPFLIWVDSPAHCRVTNLPKQIKDRAIEANKKWIRDNRSIWSDGPWKTVNQTRIDLLESYLERWSKMPVTQGGYQRFLEFNSMFDKLRGQSLEKLFPEFRTSSHDDNCIETVNSPPNPSESTTNCEL